MNKHAEMSPSVVKHLFLNKSTTLKILWFCLSLMVIIFDQASKYWASSSLIPYQSEYLLPFLNWTLAYNTGAAFSFLNGAGSWHFWFFALLSLSMSVLLSVWLIRTVQTAYIQLMGLSLLLGGALGNLIDRLLWGHVIDFIQVHYQNYYWPVFNVADSAITIGALFLMIDLFLSKKST